MRHISYPPQCDPRGAFLCNGNEVSYYIKKDAISGIPLLHLAGIEPAASESESDVLSIKLQLHIFFYLSFNSLLIIADKTKNFKRIFHTHPLIIFEHTFALSLQNLHILL